MCRHKNEFFLLAGQKLHFFTPTGQINPFFLLAGHKVDLIARCGARKSIFWPPKRIKNRVQHRKNIYFASVIFDTRANVFWLLSEKKIVCNTGKIFILLVRLLPSLCSGIQLITCNINFFLPRCIIYYFLPKVHKVHFIAPAGQTNQFALLVGHKITFLAFYKQQKLFF